MAWTSSSASGLPEPEAYGVYSHGLDPIEIPLLDYDEYHRVGLGNDSCVRQAFVLEDLLHRVGVLREGRNGWIATRAPLQLSVYGT